MEQLRSITYPIALLASGLLFSPLNDGGIGYLLAGGAAVALAVGLWSDRNYQEKEKTKDLLAIDELEQQLSKLLKQQIESNLEQNEDALKVQQTMFNENLKLGAQLLKEQKNALEAAKAHWHSSQVKQVEIEKNRTTLYLSLKDELKSSMEKIDRKIISLEELQKDVAVKRGKQWDEQMFILKENHLKIIHSIENVYSQLGKSQKASLVFEEKWKDEHDKLIEHLHIMQKYEKRKEQTLEDIVENQQDSHRQLLEVVEEGFAEADENLTDYTTELASYRSMLEKSVEQIKELNEVLHQQYLPVVDGIHATVDSLEKSNDLFQGKIEEIASSKMKERKIALEMQENLLKRLKQ